MATFPTRIKELRQQKGLSQPQLAAEIDLTKQTISLWERGVRRPDFETMEKVADYFGVSLGYLIGSTDDPTVSEPDPNAAAMEDEVIHEIEPLATQLSQLSEASRRIAAAAIREAYRVDREMERLQAGYVVSLTSKRRRQI